MNTNVYYRGNEMYYESTGMEDTEKPVLAAGESSGGGHSRLSAGRIVSVNEMRMASTER